MSGELLGYARVSTADQAPELQLDELRSAECERVWTDRASGTKADRPELSRVLEYARPGDTLVVWRLDRLARSLKHLIELAAQLEDRDVGLRSLREQIDTTTPGGRMVFHVFGALAEFEADLIRERTHAGLAQARARGRKGGRKPKLNPAQADTARRLHAAGEQTAQEIADVLGVSRATLYRALRPSEPSSASADPPARALIAASILAATREDGAADFGGDADAPRRAAAVARPARRSPASWNSAGDGALPTEEEALASVCPVCRVAEQARCREPDRGSRGRALKLMHLQRYWLGRPCPTCKAPRGQPCRTPSFRVASKPHSKRLAATEAERDRRRQRREQQLLDAVQARPGMTAAEIAKRVVRRSNDVSYELGKLAGEDRVVTCDGRRWHGVDDDKH